MWVYLHGKLNNSFSKKIKMDILTHLAKYQKEETRYLNNFLVLPDMLTDYEKTSLVRAKDELISCGYAGRSEAVKTQQLFITEAGKELLKQYHQFCHRGMLGKVTWWFKHHLEGLWKILWMFIAPAALVVNLIVWSDVIQNTCSVAFNFLMTLMSRLSL